MREIKFRIWHDKQGMIIPDDKFIICTGSKILKLDPCIEESRYFIMPLSDFDIMQFTGLLDKNGKEIYEEDIINAFDHPTGMESVMGVQVVWAGTAWRDGYNGWVLQDTYTHIEVIGNIHENPELIK